jgi:hypothetical protein
MLIGTIATIAAAACGGRDLSPTRPNGGAITALSTVGEQDLPGSAEIENTSSAARADGGPQSATGHGNLTVGGELRTFSFSAIRHQDGTVTGEWQLKSRATDVVMHGEVTCLLAIARPTQGAAFMGGVVTRVDGDAPGVESGTPVVFSAFDNGEGNDNFADAMTLVQPTTPDVVVRHCAIGLRVGGGAVPIEDGNIQVKP